MRLADFSGFNEAVTFPFPSNTHPVAGTIFTPSSVVGGLVDGFSDRYWDVADASRVSDHRTSELIKETRGVETRRRGEFALRSGAQAPRV
ncbi:hypothetical protein [Scytonema sp. PCC 10023]|uniref:hypothetical protein n=1 Tax=Scytonema sp. PCC 10023 TaxID=1680591 RepID=UPI0039C6A499